MGCGSSSLKGEKTSGPTGDTDTRPARKVQTNFGDVDFSSGAAADRRGTLAVAPDEQRRPTRISEEGPPRPASKSNPSQEKARHGDADGARLEPYKSIEAQGDSLKNTAENNPDIHMDDGPIKEVRKGLAMAPDQTVIH